MTTKDYQLEQSLGYLISRANRELSLRLFRNFKEAQIDMTPEMWGLMIHLWGKDGLTQQELSDLTSRDNAAVTRLIDNLEKRGIVIRTAHESDRRAKKIVLTTKGKELQQNSVAQAVKTLNQAAEGIAENEMEICKNVLRRIYDNLTE